MSDFPALIPSNAVEIAGTRTFTTSMMVAEVFEKEHKNVLRDIDRLDCPPEYRKLNFEPTFREVLGPNGAIRQDRYFELTKDGFTFLVMGYRGSNAALFKIAYINRFNEMAASISPIAAGMRWLAHIDRAGQMVFNPINPEDFCLPAHAWPKVIASPDFPRELLPEVVAAVGERMKGLSAPAVTAVDPHRVAAFVAGLQQVTGHEICAGLGIADNRSHQTMVGYVMGRLGWSKRKLKAWVYIR